MTARQRGALRGSPPREFHWKRLKPANEHRPRARKEYRHVRREAAAFDVNEVAHFVDQNEHRESNPEFRAECRPIKTHEGAKAQNEIQFENREKGLSFCQRDGNGSQGAKSLRPGMFVLRNMSGVRRQFKTVRMSANPFSLGGCDWQEI